jgi:hypothetical protein
VTPVRAGLSHGISFSRREPPRRHGGGLVFGSKDGLTKRTDIEAALRRLAPRVPAHEFGAVVDHALDSPGLRSSMPETAAWLSLVAYARHVLTDYDELLQQGYDQDSARFFVAEDLQGILDAWGVRRRLVGTD